MNIDQQIEQKQAELDALKRQKAEQSGMPEHGQQYWFFGGDGVYSYIWFGANSDLYGWERGNVYLTQAEAQAADRVRIAVAQINREVVRLNKAQGWVADWGNEWEKKYHPVAHPHCWTLGKVYSAKVQFTFTYGSKETWESVIKSHHAQLEIVRNGGVL
jgi:hypothetical protein